MASKNKITEVLAAIKTIYPYYAKDADIQTLVKTWGVLLKDYPDEAVTQALYLCLQKCKMPPTPADMIEHLQAMAGAGEPTDEELWPVLTKALRDTEKHIYYLSYPMPGVDHRQKIEDIWGSLPDKVKQYVGSKGELMRLAKTSGEEELKFERNRFMKVMPTIQKRVEYTRLQLASGSEAAVGRLTEGK